jgi:hypothetical protein
MPNELPTAAELRRRFEVSEASVDHEPRVAVLSDALRTGDDPRHVLSYLRGLGIAIASLNDLHDAIANLDDEEELGAFHCQEGVAVSHASDGWWLVFVDDQKAPPLWEGREQFSSGSPRHAGDN